MSDPINTVISLVTFCVAASGALLAGAALFYACAWVFVRATHRCWKNARRLYRLQTMLDGMRDMRARGHVYPPPGGDK